MASRISGDPVADALELAHRIAKLPPQSVLETKRILNSGLRTAVEQLLDDGIAAETRSFDTPEFQANLARHHAPEVLTHLSLGDRRPFGDRRLRPAARRGAGR